MTEPKTFEIKLHIDIAGEGETRGIRQALVPIRIEAEDFSDAEFRFRKALQAAINLQLQRDFSNSYRVKP